MASRRTRCYIPGVAAASPDKEMEIPESIRRELDSMGGFEALARQVPGPREMEATSRIHQALSDPLRLTILHLLKKQPLCVCVINRFTRIASSKLSYHLAILKESGLIEGHYEGNWNIYSITGEGRKYLMNFQDFVGVRGEGEGFMTRWRG